MASRARRSLARRLGLDIAQAPSLVQLQARLAQVRQGYVGAGVSAYIEKRLRGLLGGLVAALLAEAGLTAERMRALDERLELLADLVELLALDLHLPMLELLERQAAVAALPARLDDLELVRLFEGHSARLRRLGCRVLDRLHGWLVEL